MRKVKQPIQQPVQQPIQQPVQQPIQQPVQQVYPQPVQQVYPQPVQQRTGVYVAIHKDNIIKEHRGVNSKGFPFASILIELTDKISFWVDTRVAFTSIYSNIVNVIIQPEFEYKNANVQSVNEIPKILGQTIIDMLNSDI